MVTDQECINQAGACVRLAGIAENNPEQRKLLLGMAREWIAIAMHEDETPGPKSPLAQ
jgi:hypothetical protein